MVSQYSKEAQRYESRGTAVVFGGNGPYYFRYRYKTHIIASRDNTVTPCGINYSQTHSTLNPKSSPPTCEICWDHFAS